jgi:hypothetical protein
MPDDQDFRGEERRSKEVFESFPAPLRTEATALLTAFPDAEVFGLLVEDGVTLHPELGIEIVDRPEGQTMGMCGLAPMPLAHEIVKRHGSDEALRWAAELGVKEDGMLFVLVVTPHGVRMGKIQIWIPAPADPTASAPAFGEFLIKCSRNDELKLLRNSIELAKKNPVKPGQHFQRLVAKETQPNGHVIERIKLYCVNLTTGEIVITESASGRLYARSVVSVDAVG